MTEENWKQQAVWGIKCTVHKESGYKLFILLLLLSFMWKLIQWFTVSEVKWDTGGLIPNKTGNIKVTKFTERKKWELTWKNIFSSVIILHLKCCQICTYKNIIKMIIK